LCYGAALLFVALRGSIDAFPERYANQHGFQLSLE
jgi:hypothetical protein